MYRCFLHKQKKHLKKDGENCFYFFLFYRINNMKYIILILTDQDAFFRRLIKENIIYFHKFSIKIKSNVQIDFHIYTISGSYL